MAGSSRVCLVLPAFNEGSRVAASMATLDAWFDGRADIVVVDDGSADETFEEAARYADGRGHVRVHRLPRHRGKGGAVRAAVPLVGADRVLVTDADLAFDRASVERALEALDSAEMAIGNRRHAGSRYSVPVQLFGFLYRRHIVGMLFNAFVRSITPVRVRDTQCGLKAFRRSALERIAPALSIDGFAFDVELLLVAGALGVRMAEVPVNVRYESTRSTVSLLRGAWAAGTDVLRIAIRHWRGAYAPGPRQP